MKNIKIGTKLIGGFTIVALIVLVVGFFGWSGSRQLQEHIHEIGEVRLPSVESLLRTADAAEQLMVAQRTLMSEQLDRQERSETLTEFNQARDEFYDQWEFFLALPANDEEVRISNEIKQELEDWRNLNAQWLELEKEFEAIDILDPQKL